MGNEMLAEREENTMVKKNKWGEWWWWWGNRTGEKGEVKLKEDTDEWKQQTKTPSQPNPNTAAFPDLCTIKPTLLMTVRRNRRKRRSPTHSYLWLQILFLLEGANREMDKRSAKKEVKCRTVRAWGVRLVQTPAEGPLKPLTLSDGNIGVWQ